jgi:hypothetical protein
VKEARSVNKQNPFKVDAGTESVKWRAQLSTPMWLISVKLFFHRLACQTYPHRSRPLVNYERTITRQCVPETAGVYELASVIDRYPARRKIFYFRNDQVFRGMRLDLIANEVLRNLPSLNRLKHSSYLEVS